MLVAGATALEKELLACRIVFWLRENYRLGRSGSLAKEEVYGDYLDSMEPNKTDPVIVPTYFGKLVKKAFPSVRCNRKGPRGKAKQHYTHLQRVDHQREAERHRFNSFALTEQSAAPSAAAAITTSMATTPSSPGDPKHAPFQSYISSELSYLNYLLKKADPAGRSSSGDNDGWVLSKPSERARAPITREGRTDSPAAIGTGMPTAMTSVTSLGQAEGDERDWDWVFVHNKPQKKNKKPSAATQHAHKRDREARSSGSDGPHPEEAEGEEAEVKRRRSYSEEEAHESISESREQRRSQSMSAPREEPNGRRVWRSELAAEHLQPQNFFTPFHHRTPSPSSSASSAPSSPSPSHSPSASVFRSTPSSSSTSSSLYAPSSAPEHHQCLLSGPPRRHSSLVVVSPADIRDGETQSPPCPTCYNEPSRQSDQYPGLPFNYSSPFACSSFSSSSFSSATALPWAQGLSTASSFAGPSTSSLPQPPSLSSCSTEFSGSQCPPDLFSSWHSLSSSSSPALQPSSASLPSASYHPQLLSDIEPYDYHQHQHQHQQHYRRPLSNHHNSQHQPQHQQRGGEAPAYYGQSGSASNYIPLPPKPQGMSSRPMSYHTAGTYLDPQPTHTNPVLQQSRALCGDEADRGFAPLKFGGAGTPAHDPHHLPPGYPNHTRLGSYSPHPAFSHFPSRP